MIATIETVGLAQWIINGTHGYDHYSCIHHLQENNIMIINSIWLAFFCASRS